MTTKPTVPSFKAVDAADYLDDSRLPLAEDMDKRLDALAKLSREEKEAQLKATQEAFRAKYAKKK